MDEPKTVFCYGGESIELKPCPFCGSTVLKMEEQREELSDTFGVMKYYQAAIKCDCGVRCSGFGTTNRRMIDITKLRAVEKWNRRVTDDG